MLRATVGAWLLLIGAIGTASAQGETLPIAPESPSLPTAEAAPTAVAAKPFPPDVVPKIPDPPPFPKLPSQPPVDMGNDRLRSPFTTQTAGGGYQGRTFNETFDGDFGGVFYRQTVFAGPGFSQQQIGTAITRQVVGRTTRSVPQMNGPPLTVVTPVIADVTVPVFGPIPAPRQVLTPVAGRYSGIMITDNDSPRPVDRGYFGYSYYDGLSSSLNPGYGDTAMGRQFMGFEKTLFDDNASIGMRLPYIQLYGPNDTGGTAVGDLSILGKWAFYNDKETGNLMSVGMVLTTPTGNGNGLFPDGSPVPHSVIFQPWGGFVRVLGRGYVQGISNLLVPTDARDVTLWGNSLAVGYRLNDGRGLLPSITPTFETHIRTPLNKRDPNGLVYLQDQVNLTSGAHFTWGRLTISGATCVPIANPRPWNIEAIGNMNFRF